MIRPFETEDTPGSQIDSVEMAILGAIRELVRAIREVAGRECDTCDDSESLERCDWCYEYGAWRPRQEQDNEM